MCLVLEDKRHQLPGTGVTGDYTSAENQPGPPQDKQAFSYAEPSTFKGSQRGGEGLRFRTSVLKV